MAIFWPLVYTHNLCCGTDTYININTYVRLLFLCPECSTFPLPSFNNTSSSSAPHLMRCWVSTALPLRLSPWEVKILAMHHAVIPVLFHDTYIFLHSSTLLQTSHSGFQNIGGGTTELAEGRRWKHGACWGKKMVAWNVWRGRRWSPSCSPQPVLVPSPKPGPEWPIPVWPLKWSEALKLSALFTGRHLDQSNHPA